MPCGKCAKGVPRHALAEHTLDCQPGCPRCGKTLVNRAAVTAHINADCPNVEVECSTSPDCGAKVLRKDLARHVRNECLFARVDCRYKSAGCPHKCFRMDLDDHCEASIERHLGLAMGTIDREPPATMELLWTIDDATKHIRDKTRKVAWKPLTVVGPFGYKICLTAEFNTGGDKDHLGLYVATTPGPFDVALEWPFPYGFAITLLDCAQDAPPTHKSFTSTKAQNAAAAAAPGPNPPPFNRDSVLGYGWNKFISHTDLATRGYITDDKIRVRVKFTQW